jgi:hypothetical protein
MLQTNRPLEEKMTLFWHGHFATTEDKVRDYRKMLKQNEIFRQKAIGNYRDLLIATAKLGGIQYAHIDCESESFTIFDSDAPVSEWVDVAISMDYAVAINSVGDVWVSLTSVISWLQTTSLPTRENLPLNLARLETLALSDITQARTVASQSLGQPWRTSLQTTTAQQGRLTHGAACSEWDAQALLEFQSLRCSGQAKLCSTFGAMEDSSSSALSPCTTCRRSSTTQRPSKIGTQ